MNYFIFHEQEKPLNYLSRRASIKFKLHMEKESKEKGANRRIVIRYKTLWSKTEVAVLAYFVNKNNERATYRNIARAYGSSSYSNYQKACKELIKRGYLTRPRKGLFRIKLKVFPSIAKGTETVELGIPYLRQHIKKLKERKKRIL